MKPLLFSLIIALLASCTTAQLNAPDPWIGRTKAELLQERGIPDQTYEDGAGGVMLSYSKRKAMYLSADYNSDKTNTATYFIDKSGKIYNVSYKSVDNQPKKVVVKLED